MNKSQVQKMVLKYFKAPVVIPEKLIDEVNKMVSYYPEASSIDGSFTKVTLSERLHKYVYVKKGNEQLIKKIDSLAEQLSYRNKLIDYREYFSTLCFILDCEWKMEEQYKYDAQLYKDLVNEFQSLPDVAKQSLSCWEDFDDDLMDLIVNHNPDKFKHLQMLKSIGYDSKIEVADFIEYAFNALFN